MARFLAMMTFILEHAQKTSLTNGISSSPVSLNPNKPPTGSPAASTSGQANGKLDQEITKDKGEDAVTKGSKKH
jgi:hypothetical protein